MSKKLHIDLKIGIGFAISTGIFLILGLYILITIQPIINYSKLVKLETSDAIGACANITSIIKETSANFNYYILTKNQQLYYVISKNIAKLNAAVEYLKLLDENSDTLKILHKNLPALLKYISEYEESITKTTDYIQKVEESIPKLSFLFTTTINEIHRFLSVPQNLVRSTGGKDAEAFNIILKLNKIIETALISRGNFWRYISYQNKESFEPTMKNLRDTILDLEKIHDKNTISDFKEPLESFIFSIKNIEQALLSITDNYENFSIQYKKHNELSNELSNILNVIISNNIEKIDDECQKVIYQLKMIKYIVLLVVIIGVILTNTVGIILARQAVTKNEKPKKKITSASYNK